MDNIQDFYDRWKEPYHLFSSNPVVNKWREQAVESMELEKGDSVADIGCGTGANVPILLNNVGEQGQVICVDLSRESLQMIRERSSKMGWKNVHTLNADATRLPFSNVQNYFASFSIGMFPNTLGTVKKWCESLESGSTLCLLNVVRGNGSSSVFDKSMDFFTGLSVPADLSEKLEISVNGDGLDQLDHNIRSVHDYLRDSQKVLDHQERLDGYINWITVQIK